MRTQIFADPSVAGPDVRFSTGQVLDGAEQFDPVLPSIEGDPDPTWNITQWSTPADQIFDPALPDAGDADALLGAPLAAWHTGTAAGGSLLAIYGTPGDITFRLGATGGDNRDTFLQTTGYASGSVSFDRQITFQAQERLVSARAGSGTAIAFNGFTVFFNADDNPSHDATLPQTELFLQVPLTDFRGEPGAFTTLAAGADPYQRIYNVSSLSTGADGVTVADESADYLRFAADSGPLHDVSIDLNQALLDMVRLMAAQDPAMASAYLDLSRWSLGSVYAGVETGGGDGADAASLSMDIAHPLLTRDDSVAVSADAPAATVQSIDGGAYAESEDATVIDTLAGATETVSLTNRDGAQTLTGHGDDTVLAGNGIVATLHGLGSGLAVRGSATQSGSVLIDGTAPLAVSGSFATLSVSSDAAGDSVSGTVRSGATLLLGGGDAAVMLTGTADATLAGANARLSDTGGVTVLDADGASVDQNGSGGSQTVFLAGHDAAITQSGSGTQTVVGTPDGGGTVTLSGGSGTQVLWTGAARATVAADGTGTMAIEAQSGSRTDLSLGGETVSATVSGGTLALAGSAAGGSARLSVDGGAATVWGGAETLVGSQTGDGLLQATAGSGTQTLFGGGSAILTVIGSHAVAGRQTVVNGSDQASARTVVFGGRTAQTVWTGDASDTLVSSQQAGDAAGRIEAVVQGGTSAYWGGVEDATLDNLGGTLDAFLGGDGAVSILACMTGHTDTVVSGFDGGRDTLTLVGVGDPASVSVSHDAAGTVLSAGNSQVALVGLFAPELTRGPAGIVVSPWS